MNAKIRDFYFIFAGVERLKITLQYVGCKQSLGGVVPEDSCDMQMPRYRRCRDKEGFEYLDFIIISKHSTWVVHITVS